MRMQTPDRPERTANLRPEAQGAPRPPTSRPTLRELSEDALAGVWGGASNIYVPPTKTNGGLDL